MRGRGDHTRQEQLEWQVASIKVLARRLWDTLRVRTGGEIDALVGDLDSDWARAVDRVWDAVETVWDKHRIVIEPCRQLLDPPRASLPMSWPMQEAMFLGRWPDGSTRNLTREQVLMMGGQDPEQDVASGDADQVPF